jgi:hypothetical protein
MTREQKTIKLAEFEGYKSCSKQFYGGVETWRIGDGPALLPESLPKYFEDLNAVQKLKKKLSFDQQTEFVANLMRAKKDFPMTEAFFAEADEQCEVLGKTLNLWS